MLDLDPNREIVRPRDASTVVVVRRPAPGDGTPGGPGSGRTGRPGGDASFEVLCVRRHDRSGFLGGAIVFPGGKVDVTDTDPGWAQASTGLAARAPAEPAALAFAVAALRELLEEAGLAVVAGGDASPATVAALRASAREPSAQGLAAALAARGLRLDTARLTTLSRWVTPEAEHRRFDTRFYVLIAPAGQDAEHDDHETTESFWATPASVLARWEAGEVMLAPPTSHTLTVLARARTLDEVLALAHVHPLDPVCPHFALDGADAVLALPGDPLHPSSRAVLCDRADPTRFVLENGRFVPRRAGPA
ncbi:MAG: hypothetical protein IT376_07910 [Polyangiaceae bacterium]|nr:hypothetical protein [Polyangiaceae bacterium]